MNIAAFDVDGTLTTRDCVVPFLRWVAGTGGLVTGLAKVVRLHRWLDEELAGATTSRCGRTGTRPATRPCSPTPIIPCGWATAGGDEQLV
jgi:hypothetical protein